MVSVFPSESGDVSSDVLAEVKAISIPLRHRLQDVAPSLVSRWNGVAYADSLLGDNASFNPATGEIRYRPDLAESPLRWRVWLHELLHSYSEGAGDRINSGGRAYADYRGWEEAPVELLQRRLRHEILTAAGVAWDELAIVRYETMWLFNPYLQHAEEIRDIVGESDAVQFYAEMLTVPLARRHFHYLQRIVGEQGTSALRQAVPFAQRLRDDLSRGNF